jgi:hypothetical protein
MSTECLVNRSVRLIKKLQYKRHKEPGKAIEETSGCVRPERFNKGPNSMIVT